MDPVTQQPPAKQTIMNITIAKDAIKRYLVAKNIAERSHSPKFSKVETLNKLGILEHLANPEVALEKINTATQIKKGKRVPYSDNYKKDFAKTMSNIAQNLTDEQKMTVLDEHYENIGTANSMNKRRKLNNGQKLKAFECNVVDEYKAYNGNQVDEWNQGNVHQKMSKRQTMVFKPYDELIEKLLKLEKKYRDWGVESPLDKYDYQFIVAALIFLKADRCRRLDITHTRLTESPEHNVVMKFNEEGKVTGAHIKKCLKTGEKDVFLPFTDERLRLAVDTLLEIRKKYEKDHLFLMKDGKLSNNKDWWTTSFQCVMKKLGVGEGLTMGTFRTAFCKKIHESHDGSVVSEERIENITGHKWNTQQRRYNTRPLTNEEMAVIVAMEDTDGEDE